MLCWTESNVNVSTFSVYTDVAVNGNEVEHITSSILVLLNRSS